MLHPAVPAIRPLFRTTFILGLASLCLFALLCLTQRANAADNPDTPAVLGSIHGLVTDGNGAPLAHLNVLAYSKSDPYGYSTLTQTDDNGAYQLTLLPPGVYLLQVRDPHNQYATQWYPQGALMAQATDIVVAGTQLTGVNVSLTLGGYLTGTVTVQQMGPPKSGSVSFYTQQDGKWQIAATTTISPTGQYTSGALLPGVYHICAAVSFGGGTGAALTGCYGGLDVTHAADVALASTETKVNLNVDVGEGKFSSGISGVVTADGGPRAGIKVAIYYPGYIGSELVYGFTDSAGQYALGGLADGTYGVRFFDPAGVYATTYYTKLQFSTNATPITVQEGQVISNINGTLTHAGALQGNVHLYGGRPMSNTLVTLLVKANNGPTLSWRLTEIQTTTNVAGNYTFRGLWPGVYRVGINCYSFYDERCTEYYGSKSVISLAKDVVVQADQTTANIDVTFGRENPIFLPLIKFSLCDVLCKLPDLANTGGTFDTLLAALHATGLDNTLVGPNSFTLFAPTDAAFAALPKGALAQLMANPSGQLTDILRYHLVGGYWPSDYFSNGVQAITLQGKPVKITRDGVTFKVNGATILVKDIYAANGVIHVIDQVLLPPAE